MFYTNLLFCFKFNSKYWTGTIHLPDKIIQNKCMDIRNACCDPMETVTIPKQNINLHYLKFWILI